MAIYQWQKAILKERILDKILNNIINICQQSQWLLEPLIMKSLANNIDIEKVRLITEPLLGDKYSELYVELSRLAKLHDEEVNIAQEYNSEPNIGELRSAIYEVIIDKLNEHIPMRMSEWPTLPKHEPLEGMDKIRQLFVDYLTLTQSWSLERYKLALEITLEKEKLNLPSFISSTENLIKYNVSAAPGDFSNLDLSYLSINRNIDNLGGNFKGIYLVGSNLKNTILAGVDFLGANMSECNLIKADISKVINPTEIIFNNAYIWGTRFSVDHIVTESVKLSRINSSAENITNDQGVLFKRALKALSDCNNIIDDHSSIAEFPVTCNSPTLESSGFSKQPSTLVSFETNFIIENEVKLIGGNCNI